MATTFASPYSGYTSQPFQLPTADAGYRAKQYVMRSVITLAAQASADIIKLCMLPKGAIFYAGQITSTVSLGSSTVAIGNATTPGKYRAAATFTAVDTPTNFGVTANLGITPLATDEEVILTVGAATMPASGTLVVDIEYIGV